jgi:hypothetical protein
MMTVSADIGPEPFAALLQTLSKRFEQHRHRHAGIEWQQVLHRLVTQPDKLKALAAMENSGGEPDVVAMDPQSGEFIFFDCCAESPKGRRSLCYDDKALHQRKEHKPAGSVVAMAQLMGVQLLTEQDYVYLQQFGPFDGKTSSWLATPDSIRALDGALFADYRYGRVFVYHNGAQSYYGVRGFRASLRV